MINYSAMLAKKGLGYKKVSTKSHYNEPLDKALGRPAGNSRIWGDANPDVQKRVIDTIISTANKYKLNTRQTAYVLAMAYLESGYNPDAASNQSAAGVGQFLDGTGRDYGLDETNRFEIESNVDALIQYYLINKKIANKRGYSGLQEEEKIYQYHHDGAGRSDGDAKDRGGLNLAKTRVLPITTNIEKVLNGTFKGEHVDPARVRKKKLSHTHVALSTPKPRTDKKYINPAAGNTQHPHAAETNAWHQLDYYTTKVWNIASRYYWRLRREFDI